MKKFLVNSVTILLITILLCSCSLNYVSNSVNTHIKNTMIGNDKPSVAVILKQNYKLGETFENGYKKVILQDENKDIYLVGLMDKQGNIVIQPKYASMYYLGKDLYSVREKNLRFCPYAIVNSQGKQLSGFCYYQVEMFKGEYACACDNTTTFFIDSTGEIVKNLPRLKGIGTMTISGDTIKAELDGGLTYLTKEGKVISSKDETIVVKDKIKAKKINYRPDYAMFVAYPELMNLFNTDMESRINSIVKKLFLAGNETSKTENGYYSMSTNFNEFKININKNLLTLKQKGILEGNGSAYMMPEIHYYNIDLNTEIVYNLSDLFEHNTSYLNTLYTIIAKKIFGKNYKKGIENLIINKIKNEFTVNNNYLKIIIEPFTSNLPSHSYTTFNIPFSLIIDKINTDSDIWKSFDKKINKNLTTVLMNYDGLPG